MSKFKPQFNVITSESDREYFNDYTNKKTRYETHQYPTYRELRKDLKKWLQENGWFLCSTVKKYRREEF